MTATRQAFNPHTQRVEQATVVKDFFGRGSQGITFRDGKVWHPKECGWEAVDACLAGLTRADS